MPVNVWTVPAVGVSYGGGKSLGIFVTLLIASSSAACFPPA